MRQPPDKRKPKDEHAILLRLPVPLHRRLKEMAGEQRRSVHAEVLFAVEAWTDTDDGEVEAAA